MSYTTLLQDEGINSQYLVIIKPRYALTAFTLIYGTKYSKAFSFGANKITSNSPCLPL